MAGMKWDEMTAEERLIGEQAVLNMRVLNRVCRAAPVSSTSFTSSNTSQLQDKH